MIRIAGQSIQKSIALVHPEDLELLKSLATRIPGGSPIEIANYESVRVSFPGRGTITARHAKKDGTRGGLSVWLAYPTGVALVSKRPFTDILSEIAEFATQVRDAWQNLNQHQKETE